MSAPITRRGFARTLGASALLSAPVAVQATPTASPEAVALLRRVDGLLPEDRALLMYALEHYERRAFRSQGGAA